MKKPQLGLSDLIRRVKNDLIAEQPPDEPKLFSLDEIVLEINFVVTGDIDSGFDLGVVSLGSQVSEERVQKVTVRLTPLVSKDQLISDLTESPSHAQQTLQSSASALTRSAPGATRGG